MKTKKKLTIIPITESNRFQRPDRVDLRLNAPVSKSMVYRVNSVPYRMEYTEDGIKVWVIN